MTIGTSMAKIGSTTDILPILNASKSNQVEIKSITLVIISSHQYPPFCKKIIISFQTNGVKTTTKIKAMKNRAIQSPNLRELFLIRKSPIP